MMDQIIYLIELMPCLCSIGLEHAIVYSTFHYSIETYGYHLQLSFLDRAIVFDLP